MSGDGLIAVTDSNFDEEVLGSELPVLVDFWAEWCAPCRMVAPVIEELAQERQGELKVTKLNVDDNNKTAARYSIMSIPTVILFRGGEAAKQVVGALPKEALIKELGLEGP
jgi:thioredoxin 1